MYLACPNQTSWLYIILSRLPAGWPVDASIVAESLVVRYRPDLDPVLDGLSFSIRGAPPPQLHAHVTVMPMGRCARAATRQAKVRTTQ